MRSRVLVVDGYNAIRESPRYRDLVDEDLAGPILHDVYMRARTALLADVAAFAQGSYKRATVVFDGFGNLDPERRPQRTAGVEVVFSPAGVEADTVIERLVRTAREQGSEVTVVTSDGVVQSTVFGDGVTRLSSRMFEDEAVSMNARLSERRIAPHTGGPVHATVADRVDPEVRARLKEMALPRRERDARGGAGEAVRKEGTDGHGAPRAKRRGI